LGVTPRIEEWLHQGEYDRAYDALVALAERRFATPARAAAALLDLAEFYSLYGEAEAEAWRAALDEAVRRFQRTLERMGITAALEEAGVQPGDTVCIGEKELVWEE